MWALGSGQLAQPLADHDERVTERVAICSKPPSHEKTSLRNARDWDFGIQISETRLRLREIGIYKEDKERKSGKESRIVDMKIVDKMAIQTPESCVVTHVASPSKFYIATPEMRAEEEQIAESMWKFRDSDPMDEHELSNADFLAAYHKGRFWRAKRVTGTPRELRTFQYGVLTASVLLFDRGEVVEVPINKLYKVSVDDGLREIDPLCVRAHLGDVIPATRDEWSADSCHFFTRNVRREDLKAYLRGDIEKTEDGDFSMPLELLFTDAFTENPFAPEKRIETTMSRLLLREGHAKVKDLDDHDVNLTVPHGERELERTRWEPAELGPVVFSWPPPLLPEIPMMSKNPDTELDGSLKVRITHVDRAFQLYGYESHSVRQPSFHTHPFNLSIFRHHRSDKTILSQMKAYFAAYELEDGEEDVKEAWSVGEACVARMGNEWYRAQVVEINGTEAGVIFVDLGNVRRVAYRDLRVPREVIPHHNVGESTEI